MVEIVVITHEELTYPRPSMYGIFTYIYPISDPNVGKYTIHGSSGYEPHVHCQIRLTTFLRGSFPDENSGENHPFFAGVAALLASAPAPAHAYSETELGWVDGNLGPGKVESS